LPACWHWPADGRAGVTAIVTNAVVKPVVGRSRPPGSGRERTGPVTSSFPSGHAATDRSFTLGVAQEIPVLFFPLALATSAAKANGGGAPTLG
jgi:membrane-associated phospholipid phosphatase